MATLLSEKYRIKIANRYVGDVRGWKSDQTGEWLITAFKDPAIDPDDTSLFLVHPVTGEKRYIGTTGLGKDGGVFPFVLNNGDVGLLVAESPAAGDSGSLADVYLVVLNYNIGVEPAGSGVQDQYARDLITALTARVAGLERADVLDGQRHTTLVQQLAAAVARIGVLEAKVAKVKADL